MAATALLRLAAFTGRSGSPVEPTLYRCSAGTCQEPLTGVAAEAALRD